MRHELKTLPVFFEAIWRGDKLYEYRNVADRDFYLGDSLVLLEYDARTFTGRRITAEVTHILSGDTAYGASVGVPCGYAVLGIRVLSRERD